MMTLPDEVEQRVRDYLAALLSPDAARAVVAEVLGRVPGDASAMGVFADAHHALQARIRVAPEVEADVLVEEAGLSVRDAATVLGLPEPEVRAAIDAAMAAAAEMDANLHRADGLGETREAARRLEESEVMVGRVIIVADEEFDPETIETVEHSRRGAILVLVLAIVIAVAALVVAAQGT